MRIYDLEVCFTPRLYPGLAHPDYVVVVIDVLRATSAITTAFEHGLESLIPVSTVDEARELQKQGIMVGAERNAEKVEGFDFGNSPYDYMGDNLKGQTVALTTTNGTMAIDMAKDAKMVVCGAFVNLSALVNWLKREKNPVLLLCAGWKGRYNLEDALFAGAVTQQLAFTEGFERVADSALTTQYLYEAAKEDTNKFLINSSHRQRLAKLNLKEDIRYCLSIDQTHNIPVLRDGKLVKLDV